VHGLGVNWKCHWLLFFNGKKLMPNSTSPLSYNDIKELLERALLAPKGLRISFESTNAAIRWLSRANSFRAVDRKANAKLYQEGHSMHMASAYDVLLIKREDKTIELLPRSNEDINVVEL